MAETPPTPPKDLPSDLVNTLEEYSPELLHLVSEYAAELAEYRERHGRRGETTNDDESQQERPDELPDDVPTKATITVKEINDNRYYYWQWREGDKIRSKYKGPVNPS